MFMHYCYKHFLPFSHCFVTIPNQISIIFALLSCCCVHMLSICTGLKFRHSVKDLLFPKQQILDSSEQKEFVIHNFIFNESGRKISNTSNFSFSQSVFKRLVL